MDVGTEWLVDAKGCREDLLADPQKLREICDQIVADLDLHVIGKPLFHKFPAPGGVTAIYLLTESHLTLHTYPESGIATFNLYCCKPRPRWPWKDRLEEKLWAAEVRVRCAQRGLTKDNSVQERPEQSSIPHKGGAR